MPDKLEQWLSAKIGEDWRSAVVSSRGAVEQLLAAFAAEFAAEVVPCGAWKSAWHLHCASFIRWHCTHELLERVFYDNLHRQFFDNVDARITAGFTKEWKDARDRGMTTWREHAVPCNLIKSKAVEMIRNGDCNRQVSEFILKHAKIVLLAEYQHKILDEHVRDKMPSDWRFGDDVYARFTYMNVQFEFCCGNA
jgi:hypothetical protein